MTWYYFEIQDPDGSWMEVGSIIAKDKKEAIKEARYFLKTTKIKVNR